MSGLSFETGNFAGNQILGQPLTNLAKMINAYSSSHASSVFLNNYLQ